MPPADDSRITTWSRTQPSSTFNTTSRRGPNWNSVIRRVTKDAATGEVLADEQVKTLTHSELHRPLPGTTPRLTTTILHYDKMSNAKPPHKPNKTTSELKVWLIGDDRGHCRKSLQDNPGVYLDQTPLPIMKNSALRSYKPMIDNGLIILFPPSART